MPDPVPGKRPPNPHPPDAYRRKSPAFLFDAIDQRMARGQSYQPERREPEEGRWLEQQAYLEARAVVQRMREEGERYTPPERATERELALARRACANGEHREGASCAWCGLIVAAMRRYAAEVGQEVGQEQEQEHEQHVPIADERELVCRLVADRDCEACAGGGIVEHALCGEGEMVDVRSLCPCVHSEVPK